MTNTNLISQSLTAYSAEALKDYGTEVVQERAIPDYRDGLKPVHRMILWSLYTLKLNSTGPFKKSARTVGDCLTGDTLVTLGNFTNKPIKDILVGDFVQTPIGYRTVNNIFVKKVLPVLKITLENGFTLKSSYGHEIACLDDVNFSQKEPQLNFIYKRADQITSRDAVIYCDFGRLSTHSKDINLTFSSVLDIEHLDPEVLFDIEVDEAHCFFANGFLVHNCIGKYHPHGDVAAYDAMVGIAGTRTSDNKRWESKNTNVPLVEGFGNWGSITDGAAAQRYTESRLSKFADLVMLDPDYVAVSDFVLNFSEDEKVPVVLPAKLPYLLLKGSSGIAFGVSSDIPSFHIEGVTKLVIDCLSGKEITVKDCREHLRFEHAFGGVCLSGKKDILEVMKGKGTVEFVPRYTLDKNVLKFENVCPGLTSDNSIETFLTKISELPFVVDAACTSDKKGVSHEIIFKKKADIEDCVKQVLKIAQRKASYSIGITIRKEKGGAEFKLASVADIINLWCKWRTGIEVKVLDRKILILTEKISRQNLLLKAIDGLDIVYRALKSKTDPCPLIMRGLSISKEDANLILDMKVRQLQNMDKKTLLQKIQDFETEKTSLQKDLKNPNKRIIKNLEEIKAQFSNFI
jgi:DNA gyrase/topoisomerase IV subunit A